MQIKYYLFGDRGTKIFNEIFSPLAHFIHEAVSESADFEVFYDEENDFHHLKFTVRGIIFDIRCYKILAITIDGKDNGYAWPIERKDDLIKFICESVEKL